MSQTFDRIANSTYTSLGCNVVNLQAATITSTATSAAFVLVPLKNVTSMVQVSGNIMAYDATFTNGTFITFSGAILHVASASAVPVGTFTTNVQSTGTSIGTITATLTYTATTAGDVELILTNSSEFGVTLYPILNYQYTVNQANGTL